MIRKAHQQQSFCASITNFRRLEKLSKPPHKIETLMEEVSARVLNVFLKKLFSILISTLTASSSCRFSPERHEATFDGPTPSDLLIAKTNTYFKSLMPEILGV
jgi:hypothetical protein